MCRSDTKGHDEDFIFSVKAARGVCRDDRDINHYSLRKAAKALGVYWPGFGFHAFRREAITAISATAGVGHAMNAAGHTKAELSQEYTLSDHAEQERAVRAHQERILGLPTEEDCYRVCIWPKLDINWARMGQIARRL